MFTQFTVYLFSRFFLLLSTRLTLPEMNMRMRWAPQHTHMLHKMCTSRKWNNSKAQHNLAWHRKILVSGIIVRLRTHTINMQIALIERAIFIKQLHIFICFLFRFFYFGLLQLISTRNFAAFGQLYLFCGLLSEQSVIHAWLHKYVQCAFCIRLDSC